MLGLGDLSPLGQNWRTGSYLQCPPPSPTPLPGVEGERARDLTPPIAIGRGGRGRGRTSGLALPPTLLRGTSYPEASRAAFKWKEK